MKYICTSSVFVTAVCFLIAGCATVPKNPLIESVSRGDSVTVQKLVKEGAKINETDSNGITPLIHAVWSDNIEIVKTLLCLGADVNQRDSSGNSAMYHATYNYYHNIAKLLFLADRAMEKGGIQEVNKVCRDFQEEAIPTPQGRPLYEGYLNYSYLNPKINYKGNKKISIIVRDQRAYVLSKEKGVGYVGLWRERGLVRPYVYDIGTLSRKSFADDLTFCISVALQNAGFSIKTDFDQNRSRFPYTYNDPPLSDVDRIVSMEIQEWITDTFAATGLWYDVKLNVFDRENVLRGTTHLKGEDNIGGESHQSIFKIVPPTTENIISKLLNAPDIQSALTD